MEHTDARRRDLHLRFSYLNYSSATTSTLQLLWRKGGGTLGVVPREVIHARGRRDYYSFGGAVVAMKEGVMSSATRTLTYLHGDHLGSVSLTTNAAGQKVSEQRYKPYGEVRWSSGAGMPTDFTFTSQRAGPAGYVGSLTDYVARFYSPALGRFISADTIVPGADEPQAFNRYSYVGNSPLGFVDPNGHARGPREKVIAAYLAANYSHGMRTYGLHAGDELKVPGGSKTGLFDPSGRWTGQTPTFNTGYIDLAFVDDKTGSGFALEIEPADQALMAQAEIDWYLFNHNGANPNERDDRAWGTLAPAALSLSLSIVGPDPNKAGNYLVINQGSFGTVLYRSVGLEELKALGLILGAGLLYRYNTATRRGEVAPGMQPTFQIDQDGAIFAGLSFAAVGAVACVVFAPECAVVAGAAGAAMMLGGSAP